MRDRADALIQPFEPNQLLDAAHSEGSLAKSIDYVQLKNDRPPSLRGHYFDGNEQPLADTLTQWLSKAGL